MKGMKAAGSRTRAGYVSLNVKIAAMFTVLLVGILLFASIRLYIQFSHMYRTQILDDQKQVMAQNRNHLNNLINSIDQATMLLYADRTVMSILTQKPSDYDVSKKKDQINEQLIKYIYIPLNNTLQNYEISFYADMNLPYSASLTGSDLSFRGIFNNSRVADSDWYLRTVAADGALYWFRDDKDGNRMHVSRLIIYNPSTNYRNDVNGERLTLGVVVLNFDTEQIRQQLESSKLTAGTRVILLDRDGSVLFSNDEAASGAMLKAMNERRSAAADAEASGEIRYEGETFTYQQHTADNGWRLVALLPRSDISDRLGVVRNMIVTTSLFAIVLAVVVTFYLSNRISRPIRHLVGKMGGIQNAQNMQVSVAPPANDEVGILYVSFNRLMKRMNELMEDVYQSGIKEKEAELKALQAQINPHFLYNTLDSVNWIALGIGADRIATIVSSLANILRYSIKDPNESVTVREELEQVTHYINVQMLCYDHAFPVDCDIDPAVLEVAMPKLVLQPLVENAFQHGIEKSRENARLSIRGFVSGHTAVIRVENSGDGSADVARIQRHLEGAESMPGARRGYGIRNVNGRIQLLYGSTYGLRFSGNEIGGVTAVVTLPLPGAEAAIESGAS